jgi:hypothetical protein
MSRQEVIGENHTIAFGVDHATGAFVQLWSNPADRQDGAIVRIDSNGVYVDYASEQTFSPPLKDFCDDTTTRFRAFQNDNPGVRPNIGEQDVIALARIVGGFPDIAMEVYRVFGDDT